MKLQAIIFDLDQTLLNRTATFHRFLEKQYLRFQTDFYRVSSAEFVAAVQTYDDNEYAPKEAVYERVCAGWSPTLGGKLFADFKEIYGRDPVLFADAVVVLENLSERYQLGLITNGRRESQNAKIDHAGIRKFFGAIKISEEEGVKKPDPAIFERCPGQLNVAPERAVYVGDHPQNDVEAARRLGIRGIWLRNELYAEPKGSDGVVDNLTELIELLPLLS